MFRDSTSLNANYFGKQQGRAFVLYIVHQRVNQTSIYKTGKQENQLPMDKCVSYAGDIELRNSIIIGADIATEIDM